MKWHEALKAHYGTPVSDKNEIMAWEELLKPVNASNQELIRAIQMASEAGYKPEKYHVTVTDLKKWLKIYRKTQVNRTGIGNELDRKIFVRFKGEWIPKLASGQASVEEMEENAWMQPLSSTKLHQALIDQTRGNG